MFDFKKRIEESPTKFFLLLIIAIGVFFAISILVVFSVSMNPLINVVSAFYNQTNMSTTIDFFNGLSPGKSYSSECFNFNSISSIIAVLGSFSVLAYLFYSIRDGTLSRSENKKLFYGYLGIFGVVILLFAIIFTSGLQGGFPREKYFEIFGLIGLLIFTAIIGYIFIFTFDAIEENYSNRITILKFLEIDDPTVEIWQPLDNLCRKIILMRGLLSDFIFLLICLIPITGFFVGLNVLSIILIEMLIFTSFSGYCRLIKFCDCDSNVLLKRQSYSEKFSFSSNNLSNVFFLPSFEEGYFKILTKKGYLTLLKDEIITIQDNEVIVFKGKEKLLPLSIWIKRIFRFFLSSAFAYSLYWVFFFYSFFIAIFIHPNLQQISAESMSLLLGTIQIFSIIIAFSVIGLYRYEIDKWLEVRADEIIVPSSLEL